MRLEHLQTGRLLRRYKRFLADVERASGERLTVHCPNTGAMLGCAEPGSEVWFSDSGNPARKYRHTLEVVVTDFGRIGVNTARANRLMEEAIANGRIADLAGYATLRREAAIPEARGRFDFLLTDGVGDPRSCYVEVKSLTLGYADGRGAFPDAVSDRALRHVEALATRVARGDRAVLVFCVQHTGISWATSADDIHPAYGRRLREARAAGVEVLAYGCRIEPDEISVIGPLPVRL